MPRPHKTGEYVPRNLGGRWRCGNCEHVIHVQGVRYTSTEVASDRSASRFRHVPSF
jgi:hypothetical protein